MKTRKNNHRPWSEKDWKVICFYTDATVGHPDYVFDKGHRNTPLGVTARKLLKRVNKTQNKDMLGVHVAVLAVGRKTGEFMYFGFQDYQFFASREIRKGRWCEEIRIKEDS